MGFAFSNDMQLSSSAFADGAAIDARHTGEGVDLSPALSWDNPPAGTKGYAVVCHDPDAPLISANGTYGLGIGNPGDRKSNRMSTSMAHVWGVSGMHTGDCWVDFSKPVARDFSV